VSEILPDRLSDSHKGTFGTAIVVAGSVNYTGAALLAGKSSYRIGAGLVTMAVPSLLHAVLAGNFPEAIWLLLPHQTGVISADAADVLLKNIERASAILIGPGLGKEETTRNFIDNLITGKTASRKSGARIGFVHDETINGADKKDPLPRLVVDADGLRLLKKIESWEKLLPQRTILTPHPGEMADLTGLSVDAIQSDRLSIARKFSQQWGHIVVLKGAFTVIADPNGVATVIPVATSALAKAGTGDVLAGLIVGLLAQGVDPYLSAVAGAWIHAQAGLFAADRVGNPASVMAGDVVESISDVLIGLA
jgi:ADP-dependent NAD(P)H-hydrate dehydratase / NAD(P)H-hydrate epimerase